MTTEQELKEQCTPEFIKWMCGLTDYFYASSNNDCEQILGDEQAFPLLIHRAVEGWNRLNKDKAIDILNFKDYTQIYHISTDNKYDDIDYQPQSLTQAECAMLHCMLDILRRKGNE